MKEYLQSILIDCRYALQQLCRDDTGRAMDAVERIQEAAEEALASMAIAMLEDDE